MKLKHLFYSTRILWEHHQYFTLKGWLRFKDHILMQKRYEFLILSRYGIELQPKHRYRRSMKRNDMNRLVRNQIYMFTREARPMGRRKHNKWLYTPKRVVFTEVTNWK